MRTRSHERYQRCFETCGGFGGYGAFNDIEVGGCVVDGLKAMGG